MKSFGKIWIFYDQEKNKKSKPLTLVQAQATILSLVAKDPKRYHVWTPGWKEWVPLENFLKTSQDYFMVPPSADKVNHDANEITLKTTPEEDNDRTIISDLTATISRMIYTTVGRDLPPPRTDYGYYHPDFRAEEIDIRIKPSPNFSAPRSNPETDRRDDARYNFKIELVIVSKKGKTFKTYSDNLSLGGTLLQDPIPTDFLSAPFDLIIVNRFEPDTMKGRLHFGGRVVGDFKDPRRLMFVNPSEQALKELDALIKAYLSYQESMKNKVG